MPADRPNRRENVHRRYRRRHAIVLGVIVVLLVSAGVYSVGTLKLGWTSPLDAWAKKQAGCDDTAITAAPQPVDIRVFNSSKRRGLAGDTARTLKKRGFRVVQIANDSDGPKDGKQVRIRYGDGEEGKALTLASQFRSVDMKKVSDDDGIVDVILGGQFTSLKKERTVKAELKTPRPLPCNTSTPSATPSAVPTGPSTASPTTSGN